MYFENTSVSPEICLKTAIDLLAEFKKANEVGKRGIHRKADSKWCPPKRDTIKLNVHATVSDKENKIGIGVVARNEAREILLAASKTKWPFISVELAELDAIQWALDISKDRHWRKVIIKGDAQNVVKALQGKISRGLHAQVLVDNILVAALSIPQLR